MNDDEKRLLNELMLMASSTNCDTEQLRASAKELKKVLSEHAYSLWKASELIDSIVAVHLEEPERARYKRDTAHHAIRFPR